MNKLVYLLAFIAFLSSCGVKKELSFAPKNSKEIIQEVNSRNVYYQWSALQARAHVITSNQNIKINISIKNKRDSILWISARAPFGIEMFRAQLTPDSIYFLNRINKTYFIKPISNVQDFISTNFSFYDIQALISNNLNIARDDYKFIVDENGFHLSNKDFSYSVNDKYRIYNYKFFDTNEAFELLVNDYKEEYNFPKNLTFKFNSKEKLTININYLNFEFENQQKIIFDIPNGYDESK